MSFFFKKNKKKTKIKITFILFFFLVKVKKNFFFKKKKKKKKKKIKFILFFFFEKIKKNFFFFSVAQIQNPFIRSTFSKKKINKINDNGTREKKKARTIIF